MMWISVTDRLPDPGQKVLRYNKPILVPDVIDVGELVASDGSRWADPGTTHWMPLPEPPAKAEGGQAITQHTQGRGEDAPKPCAHQWRPLGNGCLWCGECGALNVTPNVSGKADFINIPRTASALG